MFSKYPTYIYQPANIVTTMDETVPKYIKELKKDITEDIKGHIDAQIPRYFKEFEVHFDKKIESEIDSLAAMTAKEFRRIDTRFEKMDRRMDGMATKEDIKDMVTKDYIADMVTKHDIGDMATKTDVKEILSLVGKYEVRALNVENILLHDHKPRIKDLEKEVFAVS